MSSPPADVEVAHAEFLAGVVRYYRCGDTGSPVVLLHGGGPDNALVSWRHALPALGGRHQVYAPDLPGQGGSLPWYGRTNQRTFEEALRWLLDEWELDAVGLVGISVGAATAAGFAARNPSRVRRLALVDPLGIQVRRRRQLQLYAAAHLPLVNRLAAWGMRAPRPVARRVFRRTLLAPAAAPEDERALLAEVRAECRNRGGVVGHWHREAVGFRGLRTNLLPLLRGVSCPMMLVHGEHDRFVPVAAARECAEELDCPLHVIEGTGHWPNRERPEEFNRILGEFLVNDL